MAFSTESLPWQTLRPTSCPALAPAQYGLRLDAGWDTYDGVVATDGARLGGERVGGAEDLAAGLDGVTAFPDHGADGAAAHVGNQSREEGLVGEIGIVLLEVLLGGGGELDGGKLEATGLEAGDDGADEATLERCQYAEMRSRREQ